MSRELDAQVSIAAYGGIAREVDEHGWLHASDEETLERALKEHCWHWGNFEGPFQFAKPLPGYSKDIAAIWPLVQEMADSGWTFWLDNETVDDLWVAEFSRPELTEPFPSDEAPTATEAACEAFIKARKAWSGESSA